MPTVSGRLIRQLPVGVLVTNSVVALIAALVVLIAGRPDWWPAFATACGVAVVNAVLSLWIIAGAAGKSADHVVTMVMLLAGVRIGVSILGLITAVLALSLNPEATAVMICGFYAATLIVESALVHRALKAEPAPSQSLQGNQG